MDLVRDGLSVVLAVPTGQGKTLPLFAASLGTGKAALLILPLLNLEGQMEKDLGRLGVAFVNMSSTTANVEALGDRGKRDVVRKSGVVLGHIAWDEAMVR